VISFLLGIDIEESGWTKRGKQGWDSEEEHKDSSAKSPASSVTV
jgi:hypothetical protein